MKKFTAVASMALALALGTCAFAADVQRHENIDMGESLANLKAHVEIEHDAITDEDAIALVYDEVTYTAADIDQLDVGDTIETENGDVKVKTIERSEGEVLVNGGYEEGGVTLWSDDDNGGYYQCYYELPAMLVIGQAQLQYADTVKFNVYKMDKDLSIIDSGYDTVEVAGTEAGAKLAELADLFYGTLSASSTTVTFGSDPAVITEVTIDYVP